MSVRSTYKHYTGSRRQLIRRRLRGEISKAKFRVRMRVLERTLRERLGDSGYIPDEIWGPPVRRNKGRERPILAHGAYEEILKRPF